jgi:hypothetical protein
MRVPSQIALRPLHLSLCQFVNPSHLNMSPLPVVFNLNGVHSFSQLAQLTIPISFRLSLISDTAYRASQDAPSLDFAFSVAPIHLTLLSGIYPCETRGSASWTREKRCRAILHLARNMNVSRML